MKFCTQCGRELGTSRTCAGCGTTFPPPRTRSRAVEPPPAPLAGPRIRYPLFADEVAGATVTTSGRVLPGPVPAADTPASPAATAAIPLPPLEAPDGPPTAAPSPAPTAGPTPLAPTPVAVVPTRPRPRARLAGAAALLALVGLGLWLVLRDTGDADRAAGIGSPRGHAVEVAGTASVSAPATDRPGVDTAGNTTSYAAANTVDGDPATTWRMAGDGTGTVLTFRLPHRTTLTEVGLVNGYAKTAQQGGTALDWYAGNRRVLAVRWHFDDGTTRDQRLDETRDMQRIPVQETTRTVRLEIVEVSAPGTGKAARDTTPISEVSLRAARQQQAQ